MTVKKFERLVKNRKNDDYVVLRAYWNYGKGGINFNEDVYSTIERLMWKHRRKAWLYKEFEWETLKLA